MTAVPLSNPLWLLDQWGGNYQDAQGVWWVVTREEGWSGPADARADVQDRDADDGADDGDTYETARQITLTGTAVAPSRTAMNAAKDRLNAAGYTSRGLYPLIVTEEHVTRVAWVRRQGAQPIDDTGPVSFDWQVRLVAPDPAKYELEERAVTSPPLTTVLDEGRVYPLTYDRLYTSSGGGAVLTVNNVGNRETGGILTFYGGCTNPGVINLDTGQILRFALTLAPDQTLEVDLKERTVLLDGVVSRLGTLWAESSWWRFAPGETKLRCVGSPTEGTPVMTARWRSAWK